MSTIRTTRQPLHLGLLLLAACLLPTFAWADSAPVTPGPAVTPGSANQPGSSGQPGQAPATGAASEFEDPVEPLSARHRRTGREEDRVRALALFAAARVAEQKQDFPQALRTYERAFRFDPNALPALREIVPLAFNLDRQSEAVRYALILAERDSTDSVLLRRLAIYLTQEGDTARALKLYEKTLALHEKANEKPTGDLVLLWMEMGRLYFISGRFNEAAKLFGQVVNAIDHPSDFGLDAVMQTALLNKAELTYQLFGECFLEAGRLDDAQRAFEKSNALKTDDSLQLYNMARLDSKRVDPAQALDKLERYIAGKYSAQGTGPYHLYAELLGQVGLSDQLLVRLEAFHAADPDNMPLAYFLAQRYVKNKQLDRAEAIYKALIESHKSRPPAEAFQGLVEIYLQQHDTAKLLAIAGESAARGGTLAALGEQGRAVVADAQQTKALVAEAQQRLQNTPAALTFGERLAGGLLAVELKDFAAANQLFAAAVEANSEKAAEVMLTWGLDLFVAGQFTEAISVFERGLKDKILPNDNPTIHYYLAAALAMADRTDEALLAAQRAVSLQPDSSRLISRVAWIHYHAKQYDTARASYQSLLDKFDKTYDSPDNREVMRDTRLALSNIAVAQGKNAESEEWLEQVLDEFPEDNGALNDLAYLWTDQGKHLELAHDMIRRAVADDPKNMAFRDSLGWILYRMGKFPEAVAELKIATSPADTDGVVLDHLAEAQLAAGDKAGATATWQRALIAFEKKSEHEKIEQTKEKITRAAAASPAK